MISHLRGIITTKQPPLLVIDINGVGYETYLSMNSFYQLPEINTSVTLLTHMIVREDAQLLYSFISDQERQLFRALIKVSGIGPKLALGILSGIEVEQFIHCVQENNSNRLVKIPGIGRKTAERLIIETRDTLANWQLLTPTDTKDVLITQSKPIQDAISALISLGYKTNEAKSAVQQISSPTNNVEELIRLALQKMMKAGK